MGAEMTDFAVIRQDTGQIVRTGRTDIDALPLLADPEVYDVEAPVPAGISEETHYWDGSGFAPLPLRPASWAVWTGAAWIDPRTPADLKAETHASWSRLRAERDRRLAATDWTQFPDAPLTDEQRDAWRDYRQALRDLTDTIQDPAAPEWPAMPAS